MGVEILIAIGGLPAYPPLPNSEYHVWYPGSQTVGDKVHCQEGNSPDRQLRSPSKTQCHKGAGIAKTARMLA